MIDSIAQVDDMTQKRVGRQETVFREYAVDLVAANPGLEKIEHAKGSDYLARHTVTALIHTIERERREDERVVGQKVGKRIDNGPETKS